MERFIIAVQLLLYNLGTCSYNFDTYNYRNTQNVFYEIDIVRADGLMRSKSECLTTVAVQSAHTMLTFLKDKCVSFACAHKRSLYQPLNGRWNFVSAIKLHRYCVGIWHIPTYVNNICTVCAWWRHQMKHFRVTGPLIGEFNGHMLIPLTKASDAELWCFLWFAPESTVE